MFQTLLQFVFVRTKVCRTQETFGRSEFSLGKIRMANFRTVIKMKTLTSAIWRPAFSSNAVNLLFFVAPRWKEFRNSETFSGIEFPQFVYEFRRWDGIDQRAYPLASNLDLWKTSYRISGHYSPRWFHHCGTSLFRRGRFHFCWLIIFSKASELIVEKSQMICLLWRFEGFYFFFWCCGR